MSIAMQLDGGGHLYGQVYRAVRAAISGGAFGLGDKLPASRALAADLGVSRTVVLAAYDCLAAEGVVRSHVGRGTIVVDVIERADDGRAPKISTRAPAARGSFARAAQAALTESAHRAHAEGRSLPYNFEYGAAWIDEPFRAEWRRALAAAASPADGYYPDPQGDHELRRAIIEHAGRARGLRCRPEDMVILSGAQSAFDLVSRCLLGPGDALAMEEPGYFGARQAFAANGAAIERCPVDDSGLIVESLDRIGGARARLVYVTPSHQMPTGAVMSVARRRELLDWARRNDAYVIEDDYDGEYRFGGPLIPSLQSMDDAERVIYVGTFSKTMFPALRLAYLAAPAHLAPLFASAKAMLDWGSNLGVQRALLHFLVTGRYAKRVRATSRRYGRQRQRLLDALRHHLDDRITLRDSRAGMHVYATLHGCRTLAEAQTIGELAARGVAINDAGRYAHDGAGADKLMLGFSQIAEDRFGDGVEALASVLLAA